MTRLAVFLGNTGRGYASTRHNAGFMLCDHLYPDATYSMKFHSSFAKVLDGMIMKPLTQMNLSGTAVSEAVKFYKLKPEEIVVVHDDLESAPGKAFFHRGGGLRGHNGLRSIARMIGTEDFCRLSIGIGRPVHGDVANWVLSPFQSSEKAQLNALFTIISRHNLFLLEDGTVFSC